MSDTTQDPDIDVQRPAPDVAVVRLPALVLEHTWAIRTVVANLAEIEGRNRIVIDLSRADWADYAGLNTLAELETAIAKLGGRLIYAAPHPELGEVFSCSLADATAPGALPSVNAALVELGVLDPRARPGYMKTTPGMISVVKTYWRITYKVDGIAYQTIPFPFEKHVGQYLTEELDGMNPTDIKVTRYELVETAHDVTAAYTS